jgi:ferric-dicitrate binding protein FerR (iron transport regulator)
MTKEQALQIIEQALNAANMKGVYSLSDVSMILQALSKANELVEIVPSEN